MAEKQEPDRFKRPLESFEIEELRLLLTSQRRRAWLRKGINAFLKWLAFFVALLALLREQIVTFFKIGGGP